MATERITDLGVKKLTKNPGTHRVAPGLYLRVRDTGASFWVLRYTIGGKAREMGLGSYPATSLAEASAKAAALRLEIKRDGTDPLARKQTERARAVTFRQVAEELIAAKRPGWKSPKHAAQWAATLATYAYPVLGDLPVDDITTEHVLEVLRPIWVEKHETATRLRQRIEAVLDAARARGYRTGDNPARWRGHLDQLLAAIPKKRRVQHHAALPWRELPPFVAELRTHPAISARALEFTIMTAARTGEVIGARWSEFDLDGALWVIPAQRMKAQREHRVPLSR